MTSKLTRQIETTAQQTPCPAAVEWLGRRRSPTRAWRDCQRGDWMLWLLGHSGGDHRTLVLAACDCAELALVHVPEGEERPRRAIETARAWARGDDGVSLRDVRAAYAAAYAAADAAYAAADAAYAAAYAADAAAAARAETHAQCADIVRRHFPDPPALGGE